jgi:Holliday junction resolvase RusA-like endonuclease
VSIVLRPADSFPTLVFTLVVYGEPVPQGSKRAYPTKGGRIRLVDDNPRLDAWRERIMLECYVKRFPKDPPIDAPCCVTVTFYLRRPPSLAKRVVYPATKPDLDKLARGCFDGLKDGGVLAEDSRPVDLLAFKRYANGSPPCMAVGVFVQ